MNSLILAFDVAFAVAAAVLTIFSLNTLRAIKHLRIGRSFWIPILMSGIGFLVGSVFTIFREINFPLTAITNEVIHVSQLLALCLLVVGIFSYSRKVKESLIEKISAKEGKDQEKPETETPVPEGLIIEIPTRDRKVSESSKAETAPVCKRQFGYLRMLPHDASIPSECLRCPRLIECRHSSPELMQAQQEKAPDKK